MNHSDVERLRGRIPGCKLTGMNSHVARLALVVILLGALGASSPAFAKGQYEKSREEAIRVLLKTEVFADNFVGFIGRPSDEVCSFRTVLAQPDADALFKEILTKGHLAGRLYALCGLYFTDHERFAHEIQPYRKSADSVATYGGCIMGRERVDRLVERSEARVIRLKDPSETTAQWLDRHPDPTKSRDYSMDILGGGWPAHFKEMKGCDR